MFRKTAGPCTSHVSSRQMKAANYFGSHRGSPWWLRLHLMGFDGRLPCTSKNTELKASCSDSALPSSSYSPRSTHDPGNQHKHSQGKEKQAVLVSDEEPPQPSPQCVQPSQAHGLSRNM